MTPSSRLLSLLVFLVALPAGIPALALDLPRIIGFQDSRASLALVRYGRAVPVYLDVAAEPAGVLRAVGDFRLDVERVTGVRPPRANTPEVAAPEAVFVGTVGASPWVERWAAAGKLDLSGVRGRWEAFQISVVEDPMPGLKRALVVVGADRRGTIFGLYELSEQMGVSPWYWWADVPVARRDALYARGGVRVETAPHVKYRGIFLNDEAPALTGWVSETFGGYNSDFYVRVFELILRLRGNFLWPAMWDAALYDDDPMSAELADRFGVVISTTHHEPMMRWHKEWYRYGEGAWNYATNDAVLREFWEEGIRRARPYEHIITLGMRGDGDEAMSEETNIDLLERIVSDQRAIIDRHYDRPVEEVPQVWALYKEVQDYFEHGMRVPDDVTLLWSDDNWGNIRRLPTPDERDRAGGAGVYYHFDYVGGPRSYKWINVTPLTKVWEQMHLGWQYGADRIWIVNVGDLKPMEFPIEFFLTYGWQPKTWPYERLGRFGKDWARRNFGPEHAAEIADMLALYTKYNRRRTPELLDPDTFSLVHYDEARRVLADWRALAERAERIGERLPEAWRDAYFQLVLYPIQGSRVVNELYVTAGFNRLYGLQGRTSTNALADRAEALFAEDAEWARRFHEDIAGGKWNHMMAQNNIGWTYWQQPHRDTMPAVTRVQVPQPAEMGVSVDGSSDAWPTHDIGQGPARLPEFSPFGPASRTIEIFNRGRQSFAYEASADVDWIRLDPAAGTVGPDTRMRVSVDWDAAPVGRTTAAVTVRGAGQAVRVAVPVFKPVPGILPDGFRGFVEADGHVAIEAPRFQRAVAPGDLEWKILDDHGRMEGGVTPFPVTANAQTPGREDSPRLEYDVFLFSEGEITVEWHLAPSQNFQSGDGLLFAASLDDADPTVHRIGTRPDQSPWYEVVADSVRVIRTTHQVNAPGVHTLKFWMVHPGAVLQRIVVDAGGLRPSYLGPPASPVVEE